MTTVAKPVSFHEAQSVWHSVEAIGKKELAKRCRSIAFQVYADEQMIRHAVKVMRELNVSEEVVRPFAVRVGMEAETAALEGKG